MARLESLPRPTSPLDSATWAIRQASLRLGEASMEGIGECVPLLEDALHRVDSFHRDVTAGRCEDQSGLESRAEELRDSLVTFLALACQLRAYYESISAEMARGQMSYTSSALTSLSSALAAPTFAEL